MDIRTRIIAFFGLAEAIATLWAIIPFIIVIFQQQSDPTNPKYIVDMFSLLPNFLIGQIPGMIISAFIQAIFGLRRNN